MNEPWTLILSGVGGLFIGAFFFGGLWWTVRKGALSPHPALWFFGSLLLRMGIVLAGFFFIGGGQWQRLLVCLLGFVIARFFVLRLTRAPLKHFNSLTKKTSHAP